MKQASYRTKPCTNFVALLSELGVLVGMRESEKRFGAYVMLQVLVSIIIMRWDFVRTIRRRGKG